MRGVAAVCEARAQQYAARAACGTARGARGTARRAVHAARGQNLTCVDVDKAALVGELVCTESGLTGGMIDLPTIACPISADFAKESSVG